MCAETNEAADTKEEKEQQPAAKSEPSQDSDEMPLVKAIQTAGIHVEIAAEAEQQQDAKTPRTFARRKKTQEAAQEDAPDQAAEKAEADAEEAKSPKARRGKSQEAGQLGSASGAAEAEDSAQPLEPRSPKAKRKRQSDADQLGEQDDASDQAPGTEGKQAARKRRRAKTAPAPGKAGKGAAAGRRNTKSREVTPEVHAEAEAAPGPDQAAGQQRAAAGAAGQQAKQAKTGPVSELEHIREGLQKAEEAHERKLGELRHLDAQVRGTASPGCI